MFASISSSLPLRGGQLLVSLLLYSSQKCPEQSKLTYLEGVVTGEIFPLGVRAKGLSMTTASNWLLNWAIAYSTPFLVNPGKGNADLQAKIFFLWGGCCLLCAFFVWGMIYETKGLSLEEVDEMYETVDYAWKSNSFVPKEGFHVEEDQDSPATGEKLREDVPEVDHSSEHTEVNNNGVANNGLAKETVE